MLVCYTVGHFSKWVFLPDPSLYEIANFRFGEVILVLLQKIII
jgi:hypothetical protein